MFDSLSDFFALLVAAVALLFARKALNQSAALRTRLDLIEQGGLPAASSTQPRSVPDASAPFGPAETPPLAAYFEPAAMSDSTPPSSPEPAMEAAQTGAVRPSSNTGLEERVGTRWVVWIGALTLALGGFFLVRYSIDAGLLGPGVRIMLGGAFALALLLVGEWMRRWETALTIATSVIANIPALLTAAGTAVAFATVYAAYALYDFLVPATAFMLLGLVALGTLAAALLHGPALAGLGIAGAFSAPILVSSNAPDYWALYIYLGIVTGAAFGLARIRLWRWLAITTIVCALLWMLPCLPCGVALGPHLFHAATGFALAALLVVCGLLFGPSAADGPEPVSSGSLAAYLLGAAMIVLASSHADTAITVFALMAAGTIVAAWRSEAATGAVAAAAFLVFAVFAEWAVRANSDMLVQPGGALPGIGPAATDGSVALHLTTALVFAVGFGGAGFLVQGRSSSALVSIIWSAAGVFTPLALLVALYARIAHLDRSIPFAILAVLLAAAFAAATEILGKRPERPGLYASVALFATGTLAALALALTFALEKGWLTIALALMSAATAWVATQRPIPFLRHLAAILASIVVVRAGLEPRVVGTDVGTTPIFNWLLWGYGVPALCFWAGSVWLRRQRDDAPLRTVEAAAVLFTVLLAFLEIRHAINHGDIYRDDASLTEVALQVCVALAMAIGLERLRIRTGSLVHNVGAVLLTVFAVLAAVLGPVLVLTPMLWPTNVGGVVINLLLLAYAMPAILALLLSYAVAGRRKAAYGNTIAAFALLMALTYVSLEVRRFYQGPVLSHGGFSDAEQYSYSIAWLAFGVILLGIGIWANSQRARLASAALIALTIGKAFLIDMSTLTGIYRALSFMCLGLVLVAIGWLYQKILFRPPTAPSAAVQPET